MAAKIPTKNKGNKQEPASGKSTSKNSSAAKSSGKKKSSEKQKKGGKQPYAKIRLLLAITFLSTLCLAGLFIITNWPEPVEIDQHHDQQIAPQHYPITEAVLDINQDNTAPNNASPEITLSGSVPKIAIIMDDMGINFTQNSAAIHLDIPLTCAIIPGERYSTQTMELARKHLREIMVHMPMEPINYPKNNPGDLALFIQQSDEEIQSKTQHLLDLIPYASGVNNHMGSAFTQNSDKMKIVLQVIKEHQLFFVDSLTIATSVAYREARLLDVPTAKRDVFLDNERDVDKILSQLDKLVSKATATHSAIGICHPYPETIAALAEFSTKLDSLAVKIVPVSQLVH